MSRTAATANLIVTRGATWEDSFTYTDDDGVAINLTGYEARMQVRSIDDDAGYPYGTDASDSLVLELTTANGFLEFNPASGGVLKISVPPADHADLNPANEKKVTYAYSVEVFIPAGADPEYVLPLARGKIIVLGEIAR